MLKICFFTFMFLSFCNSFAKSKEFSDTTKIIENYSRALYNLCQIADSKEITFKEAVFITENAFFDNKLNKNNFDELIKNLSTLSLIHLSQNDLQYEQKDRNIIAKYASVFKIISDTVVVGDTKGNYIYHLPFGYDFEDFFGEQDWTKTFVTKLLVSKKGNCHSLPYLYKILCEELGVSAHLALAPNHVYIKHRSEKTGWYNTELTSATFPIDAWLMASGYIHLSAIQNGVYMKALSDKECIALCLVDLAEGYKRKTNYKDPDFILKCCDTALLHFPNCINALLLKTETLKHIFENPNVENAVEANEPNKTDEKRQKQFLELQNLYLKIHDLGYRQMPQDMYFEWLLDLKTEKDKHLNKNVGGSKKR